MSLAKKELIEKYEGLNGRGDYYYEDIFDLRAQTINSKYMKARESGYVISKGKSAIFKRALLTFLSAFLIVFISMFLLNGEDLENSWVEPLFVLPRILALVAVVLGMVRLKTLRDIPPFLEIRPEGIVSNETTLEWDSIEGIFLKTSMSNRKQCDVIVHTNDGEVLYDFRGIDEIPEDACIVISKYWKRYRKNE